MAEEHGPGEIGRGSFRKTVLRIGTYPFVMTAISLLAVLSSFAFALGSFPMGGGDLHRFARAHVRLLGIEKRRGN